MLKQIPDLGPLQAESWEETAPNTFKRGNLINRTALLGWELADRTDPVTEANGVVLSAEAERFRFIPFGTIVFEPEHGRGADAQFLWLDENGGYRTDSPGGPTTRVIQLVAKVIDSDHILYFHRAWLAV